MNIKQQLEQVLAEMRIANNALYPPPLVARQRWVSELSAIVEQMNADEQAIVDEVNKRWPTGKPQPDDTFVGDRTSAAAGTDEVYTEYGNAPQMPSASVQQNGAEPVAILHDDGCYTFCKSSPEKSHYAGWRMEVYATPQVPDGMVLVQEVLLRQIAKWLAESADPYDKAAYAINGLIAAAKEEG